MAFIDRIMDLISDRGITRYSFAAEMGLGKNAVDNWKARSTVPSATTVGEIAKHYEYPMDFFLENGPFVHWDAIKADKKGFIDAYSALQPEDRPTAAYSFILDGGTKKVESLTLQDLARIIDVDVEELRLGSNGEFEIKLKKTNKGRALGRLEADGDKITPEQDQMLYDFIETLIKRNESGDA